MQNLLILIALVLSLTTYSQTLEKSLVGKTFARDFYPLGLKHTARYTFYHNKVTYSVDGFFVSDTYEIKGNYYKDRFVGYSPQNKAHYILYIRIKGPNIIEINKQGHDPRYSAILKNKPVKGWHIYHLGR